MQQMEPDQQSMVPNLDAIAATGSVCDSDVLALRRHIFPDGIVDRRELEALFAIGERAPKGDQSWPNFFAEVCADFFLNEEQPTGYITQDELAYLTGLVTRDGKIASPLELNALVHLIDRARQVPADMVGFVCDQIQATITARQTNPSQSSAILASDVIMIRKVLYAAGGSGATGITRQEADFLFDLHDASVKADNCDEWRDLFVKAICAHLMQHVGYVPLAREEALRQRTWAADHSVKPGRFMRAMTSGGLQAIKAAYKSDAKDTPDMWQTRNEEARAGSQQAAAISMEEAKWLTQRIGQNGAIDDAERALIVYLRDHLGAALPARLTNFLDSFGRNVAA